MRLLRKIRDIMTSTDAAEARLNQIVHVIAHDLQAEVCSVYLLRAGEVLELFASEGLKATSVHRARLAVGEGLVGHIAANGRPLYLKDAQKHPHFKYLPETGEEKYHSFAGVPILRSRQVIGVLVVQHRSKRTYLADEGEVLQTIAMVLAELVGSGEFITSEELKQGTTAALFSKHLTGIRLNTGIVRGVAVIHRQRMVITKLVADNTADELERFEKAVGLLHQSVDALAEASGVAEDEAQREIVEAYQMFARDQGWLAKIRDAINTGLTAEAAVRRVQDGINSRMKDIKNDYLRERMQDVENLSIRLLTHLAGHEVKPNLADLPEKFILVAKDIGPAELLEYDSRRVVALVLEDGSPTSHVVIIARAMDLPVIGRIDRATSLIQSGDPLIVNADAGELYIRPGEDVEERLAEHIRDRERLKHYYAGKKDEPSVTADGMKITLNVNAGLFNDITQLKETGAQGIGLYRTEIPYMVSSDFPDVDTQTEIYSRALIEAGDKPVVFRTVDIGGDKRVSYLNMPEEANPAMGWRAVRIALDRPGLQLKQFRALLRASAGKTLNVMFPMIAEVAEFEEIKRLLDVEVLRCRKAGEKLPDKIRVGAMLEVPSIVLQIAELLKRVDFVSIGSNDLLQFLFACDRGSPGMADRYDPLSSTAVSLFRYIVSECRRANVPVSFCGDIASRPLEAMCLIGLGVHELSMPAPNIGPVKEMVRHVNAESITSYMDSLRDSTEHSLRSRLLGYAADHKVPV